MKVNRTDKNGTQLHEGDIVAECELGSTVWDGKASVVRRPLGVVVVYTNFNNTAALEPEETDFYNIAPLRTGLVKLSEKADVWMRGCADNTTTEIHLSRYDGRFYGWDNIERIGSIYDFLD